MNELEDAKPKFRQDGSGKKQLFTVKVPASSANLGPGFDSLGIALNLYLTVVAEKSTKWQVIPLSEQLADFPEDDNHFICRIAIDTALKFGRDMPPLKMTVKSEIPLARGLGSSAAAIVAGIELADYFCGLELSKKEKLQLAAVIEGHPDNAGACLYGGFVVGSQNGGEVDVTVLDQICFDPVLVVPHEELLTEVSRDVLPKSMGFAQGVQASANANQLLAALLTEQWQLAGRMIRADLFHQPYRKALVPFFDLVDELAIEAGAFGVALSGAGPAILCLSEPGKGDRIAKELEKQLQGLKVHRLEIDRQGCETQAGKG